MIGGHNIVDKSTVQCGQVQTTVSPDKPGPGQDRASVKESRFVIKVMKVTREGDMFPKVRKNQRMYQAFSLVHK
jgi:hypothetical protein